MRCARALPADYKEIYNIDLQKNKKMMLWLNAAAIIVAALMAVPAAFLVPIFYLFNMEAPIAFFIRLGVLAVGSIAYIIAHELVHGVAMKICGTKKVRYGFTGVYAFAGSDDYYDKSAYIFIALAPVVLLGAILAVINAIVPSAWFWIVYIIQITNISGAVGDYFVTVRFLGMPKDILVKDHGTAMCVYSASADIEPSSFSVEYVKGQIEALGIPNGAVVIMHTAMRSVGKIEGGAEALLDLLIENITSRGGMLCVPTHTWSNLGTDNITLDMTKRETNLGAFPTVALNDSRGIRTKNPTHSMVVFGEREQVLEFIAGEENVKMPTAPEGCYGKLCTENGYVLLVGVDQNKNTYLHSVEEMLGMPSRTASEPTKVSTKFEDGSVRYSELYMFGESVHGDVSQKFYMYEPAFRARGAIRDGHIGDAPVQLCSAFRMKETLEVMVSRAPGCDPLAYDGEIPPELYL